MTEPLPGRHDVTDWAAIAQEGCDQCGFQPVGPDRIPGQIRETINPWRDVLRRPGVGVRPESDVWSALEYGCHVRDLAGAFADRLERVLAEEGAVVPEFDGESAAIEARYWEDDPENVAEDLALRAEFIARGFNDVPATQWDRSGLRSDGYAFTIATMSNSFLHELVHHLHDVGAPPS